ncbi:MAG: helix-turn-helix domain-containing protein [Terriglobia bacterium]
MTQKQLDNLSSSLSKAINPAARKIEATAKILEQIEPLPVVSKPSHHSPPSPVKASEAGSEPGPSSGPETVHVPVENSLANLTTVAKKEGPGWPICPRATPAKMTTVADLTTHDNLTRVDSLANLTEVKGTLHVPNTIVDGLLPALEPAAALLYLRLYRLSHGYRNESCIVGLQKLATATHTSQKTIQRAIDYLEKRRLIVREGVNLGGRTRGLQFRVRVPGSLANLTTLDKTATVVKMASPARVAKMTTLVNLANNKDDDLLNTNHHQSGDDPSFPQPPIAEPQRARAAWRESGDPSGPSKTSAATARIKDESPPLDHLAQTITAYTSTTKNPWLQTDTVSYLQHRIDHVPVEKLKTVIQTVFERAECRINSFAYFVKEILGTNNQRTLGGRREALAGIIRRVRENHMGLSTYGMADLVFDVKNACVREGVVFDNDLFNQLINPSV